MERIASFWPILAIAVFIVFYLIHKAIGSPLLVIALFVLASALGSYAIIRKI